MDGGYLYTILSHNMLVFDMEKTQSCFLGFSWIFLLFQNLLRNQAKAGCQTNFTYIPDIDMVSFRISVLYLT